MSRDAGLDLEGPPRDRAPTSRQWGIIATLVFVAACAQLFGGFFGHDLSRFVPANITVPQSESRGQTDWESLGETDLRFVVWLIARNAWTLVNRPGSLFEAEQCAPAHDALAFGEPGIALGLLAAPIRAVVRDPIVTFNLTLVAMTLLAALALFLLVREWTASPPAGIVAGVLYAYHALKIGDIVHVIIWDTAWTGFAIYFATRLFRTGARSAAIGLAASITMQLAGSLYPLLAAVLIGIPLGGWLLVRYGMKRARPIQLAAIALWLGVASRLIFAPYLAQTESGPIEEAAYQVYRPISYLLPGGSGFSGWVILGLAVLGLALPVGAAGGSAASPQGDLGVDDATPLRRAAASARGVVFLAGGLIFALTVVGEGEPGQATQAVLRGEAAPDGFPNLYLALSALIPGLDAVRGPGAMYGGVHLLLCVLAGLGAAALIERAPIRRRNGLAAVLIGLALLDTLRPAALGLAPRAAFEMFEIRPDSDSLALFDALREVGDGGPLLEYPVHHVNMFAASKGVLLSAYHHRRTSYCYNSFLPAVSGTVAELSARLPAAEPLDRLYEMGFRTVIVHHSENEVVARRRRVRFERFAAGPGTSRLTRLAGNDSLTAYRIVE